MAYSEDVYAACRVSPRVFVLNPAFKRANFYFQQLRCLALVRELFRRGDLKDWLIVVGGGVAGLTTAAAGLTGNATVTLIEENEKLLDQYREANHRELHPNISAWPFQELRAMTNLPFLNWTCAQAPTVVRQILDQWNEDFAPKVTSVHDRAIELAETTEGVEVICRDGARPKGDIAVVTAGWARERPVSEGGSIRGVSYWTQQSFEPPDEVTVTGSGDGGLIDSAYQTFGPQTVAASRILAYLLHKKPHKTRIQDAENEALKLYDAGHTAQAYEFLKAFYDKFNLEDEDSRRLLELKRYRPLRTRLYHREPTPFSPVTAPINKVLLATLTRAPGGAVRTEKAELEELSDASVVATTAAGRIPVDKMRLIVRHGAESAAWPLLSAAQRGTLESASKVTLAEMVPDNFDREFFHLKAARPLAASPSNKPKRFYERVSAHIKDMLYYMSGRHLPLKRIRDSDWEVTASGNLKRLLEPLFPITADAVTVRLTESRPRSDGLP